MLSASFVVDLLCVLIPLFRLHAPLYIVYLFVSKEKRMENRSFFLLTAVLCLWLSFKLRLFGFVCHAFHSFPFNYKFSLPFLLFCWCCRCFYSLNICAPLFFSSFFPFTFCRSDLRGEKNCSFSLWNERFSHEKTTKMENPTKKHSRKIKALLRHTQKKKNFTSCKLGKWRKKNSITESRESNEE